MILYANANKYLVATDAQLSPINYYALFTLKCYHASKLSALAWLAFVADVHTFSASGYHGNRVSIERQHCAQPCCSSFHWNILKWLSRNTIKMWNLTNEYGVFVKLLLCWLHSKGFSDILYKFVDYLIIDESKVENDKLYVKASYYVINKRECLR